MNYGDLLSEVLSRVAEIERRIDGTVQNGTIAAIDPVAGTVRVRLGGTDDKPFLSPPIPVSQAMGALKLHSLPSIGQQVTTINASGDYRLGIAIPMTQSDANPSPSQVADEHVMTFGPWTIKLTGAELSITGPKVVFTMGGVSWTFDGAGLVQTGGSIKHDGLHVDKTHVHGGIIPGGDDTLPPAN